jgi:WD40 repeat protein
MSVGTVPSERRGRKSSGAGYDAFISYSHAADGKLAPSLQRGLRSFAKPWYRLGALRIFRDETSLSATPALWSGIERALANSQFFVLLASPDAADSPWVNKEVTYWLEHKPMENFLIAVTEGEIVWDKAADDVDWNRTTALPRSLESGFASEPLWVDLRFARKETDLSLRRPMFRDAIADLAAPIRGRDKDTLLGEDITEHRRTMRLARGGVAILIALLVAASVSAFLAVKQRDTAQSRLDTATSLLLASVADRQPRREFDVSLLLGFEAYRTSPTAQATSSVISALEAARQSGAQTVLRGNLGPVDDVAFGPGGHILAAIAGDSGARVLLWDARTHRQLGQPLDSNGGSATGVAFSPDGHTLAEAESDGRVVLWDTRTHARLGKPLIGNNGLAVQDVAFSPTGNVLASAGYDGTVTLWDTRRHTRLGPVLKDNRGIAYAVAFSPDGQTLAVGVDEGVQLWNTRTFREVGHLRNSRQGGAFSVAFSRDGQMLASGGDGGTVVWDPHSHRQLGKRMSQRGAPVYAVDFSPDSQTVMATAGGDGTVRLWDPRTRTQLGHTLNGDQGPIHGLSFSTDGRTLASAGSDGTVWLWNTRPNAALAKPLNGHQGILYGVAFSPDGHTLASAGGGSIVLWNMRTHKQLGRRLAAFGRVVGVAFSPDGRTLASIGDEGTILWDVHSHARLARLPSNSLRSDYNHGVAFSSDGHTLAAAAYEGVQLWDARTRARLGRALNAQDEVTDVAFSPDGRKLASGSSLGTVLLWNIRTHTKLGHALDYSLTGAASALAFSPDRHTLAVAGEDGTVMLWDTRTYTRLGQPIDAHQGALSSVAFSPDGRTLAAAGENGTVLWDARTHTQLGQPLNGRQRYGEDIAFSPDGLTLASAGFDGTVWLWTNILWHDAAGLRQQVCKLVTGDLTRAQWAQLVPGVAYHTTCRR